MNCISAKTRYSVGISPAAMVLWPGFALWSWAVIILVALVISANPGAAMEKPGTIEARFFEGNVTDFSGAIQFRLDCCDESLLIGMVRVTNRAPDNISRIQAIIRSHRLSCTGFAGEEGTGQLVWCNTEDGKLMSQLLLERSLVVERCEYSGNQFGTC